MSAHICIESGVSAGTSYWIDRPVLRVGSDPQCEICLPSTDLAPHALTIEFRDGRYRAYNRGTAVVSLGGVSIPPGSAADLRPDQSVELPGDLRLVLKVDGDPRPSPRPAESSLDDEFDSHLEKPPTDATAGEAVSKKSSNTLLQLAVIGFCLLGGGVFLMMSSGEAPAETKEIPTFEELVVVSLEKGDAARDRLHRLQFAEAALVRGNYELARSRFTTLRGQLVRHNESLPDEERGDTVRFLEYVEYQMSQL